MLKSTCESHLNKNTMWLGKIKNKIKSTHLIGKKNRPIELKRK